jgi:hypothetical protein
MSDKAKEKGYKGHRAGTKAEKAHRLVDENPKADWGDLATKIEKLGVSKSTAGHWVSVFRNWGKTPKAKTVKKAMAKKPAVASKSKPTTPAKKPVAAKPTVKAKAKSAAPVIKKAETPAAPAGEGATA